MGTTAANLLLWSMRKGLADELPAYKEKLRDELAAVPNRTTLANVSNLNWLNDIPELIENLQAEIGMDISSEQVSSSKVTVRFTTKLEGCPVTSIYQFSEMPSRGPGE